MRTENDQIGGTGFPGADDAGERAGLLDDGAAPPTVKLGERLHERIERCLSPLHVSFPQRLRPVVVDDMAEDELRIMLSGQQSRAPDGSFGAL